MQPTARELLAPRLMPDVGPRFEITPMVEPVDCVILDLFGVVIAFDDSLVYDRLAARCQDADAAFDAMRDLVSSPDLIRGTVSLESVWVRLTSDLGLDMQNENPDKTRT